MYEPAQQNYESSMQVLQWRSVKVYFGNFSALKVKLPIQFLYV